jgi:hypothetical protein
MPAKTSINGMPLCLFLHTCGDVEVGPGLSAVIVQYLVSPASHHDWRYAPLSDQSTPRKAPLKKKSASKRGRTLINHSSHEKRADFWRSLVHGCSFAGGAECNLTCVLGSTLAVGKPSWRRRPQYLQRRARPQAGRRRGCTLRHSLQTFGRRRSSDS